VVSFTQNIFDTIPLYLLPRGRQHVSLYTARNLKIKRQVCNRTIGGWRHLRDEDLHNFYTLQYVVACRAVPMQRPRDEPVSGQRLCKHVPVARQQILNNATVGLQQWKRSFSTCSMTRSYLEDNWGDPVTSVCEEMT
jgi:hypothetical protein